MLLSKLYIVNIILIEFKDKYVKLFYEQIPKSYLCLVAMLNILKCNWPQSNYDTKTVTAPKVH